MNREVYKYLLHTYGRNPGQWFGFACEVVHIFILRVYVVIIMAQVASSIAAGDIEAAKRNALYFLIAYAGGAIIGTIGQLASVRAESLQYQKLSRSYHNKLIGKDMSFYRDNQTGYLTGVFRQHLDAMVLLIRFFRGDALGVTVSLTLPVIVLLLADLKMGLITLAIIIVQLSYVMWSSSKSHRYRKAAHELYRKMTGEVSDEITNIIAFKSGGIEKQAHTRVAVLSEQEGEVYWSYRKAATLLDFPRSIITAFGIFAAIYLIINSGSTNDPEALGLIVLTLTYLFQIVRNVAVLPELVATHDDLITKLHPTLQYLNDEHENIRDPEQPAKLTITTGAIDIEDVSFSYPSHSDKTTTIPVFKDLSLHLKGGERVGMVGLSGAGKSTLASLLLRFDDVEAGAIKIDGIDIRSVRQSELRQSIAYVPQEPLLFHRSIRENIAYYNTKASDEEIMRAAKAAHAHEFITKLPDGYNTTVGERGVKLSGGQKQRVAIARAVLKKAPIMIFDEATSALDSESEQIIQRALPEIIGKQTAIVVAHRLSTVAGLDRIIVMHEGKIIEEGSHDELLKLCGRYFGLWQKQTS